LNRFVENGLSKISILTLFGMTNLCCVPSSIRNRQLSAKEMIELESHGIFIYSPNAFLVNLYLSTMLFDLVKGLSCILVAPT